ncbi:UNVERIFIED_CONTAM: hypothetical protein FKN15_038209 [Acipenser sinensis]
MAQFTGTLAASLGEPSSALGSQASPLRQPLSPAHSIPCAQAPSRSSCNHSRSPSRDRKRVKNVDQAQILEHLSRQQASHPAPAPAPPPAPAPEQTPASPLVAPEVSEQDVVMSEGEQDALSIAASWDEESFLREETQDPDLTQETGPSSELASEPEVPAPSAQFRRLWKEPQTSFRFPGSKKHRSVFSVAQVAQENLVFEPLPAAAWPALGVPAAHGSLQPGERHPLAPRTGQTPAVGLAPERDRLSALGFSDALVGNPGYIP